MAVPTIKPNERAILQGLRYKWFGILPTQLQRDIGLTDKEFNSGVSALLRKGCIKHKRGYLSITSKGKDALKASEQAGN